MSNSTFKPFVDKMGNHDVDEFIGNKGEIFYDPDVPSMRLSDGVTPGGIRMGNVINTDGDPGATIYVGSVDPANNYTLMDGDIWINP